MKNRKLRIVIPVVTIAILLAGALAYYGSTAGAVKVNANSGTSSSITPIQRRLLDGLASSELNLPQNAAATKSSGLSYFPDKADNQCALKLGSNTKVNQNCLNLSDPNLQGRAQAQNETSIAQDPFNPSHLVASYNDYRRGDGTCGVDYTLDGGQHWNDATTPNGFTSGAAFGGFAREYWQASGDTAVAWDTRGNAYLQCMAFMRGQPTSNNPDLSSGIYVFRSTQNNGASWNFAGRPVAQQINFTGSIVPLLDKPYMTVDNHVSSKFRDRIYVTYTLFGADGSAIIYEAFSSDFGQTFSAPVLVSASSPLCPISFGVPTTISTCNSNTFSDPFTGPDGALYVVYDNYNTVAPTSTTDNHNQILLAKSTNGGLSFSAPVLVANFNDLPDCDTYQGAGQDPFRACVPEKGTANRSVFRAANYPSGAVNPTNKSQVVVTFGSYINADSNPSNGCVPAGLAANLDNLFTGVKTPGACNNKILESVSTNSGTSFNGTVTDPTTLPIVSSAPRQKFTDQWWQWEAFTTSGKLEVSYYDRQYGNDEFNGFMDYSLSGSKGTGFGVVRVTSASMPPPTQFPNGFGNSVFFGDYSGLTAVKSAFPLWMDTRDKDLFYCTPKGVPAVCTGVTASGLQANDQDIFTQQVTVP